jgi:hypothetical protein
MQHSVDMLFAVELLLHLVAVLKPYAAGNAIVLAELSSLWAVFVHSGKIHCLSCLLVNFFYFVHGNPRIQGLQIWWPKGHVLTEQLFP